MRNICTALFALVSVTVAGCSGDRSSANAINVGPSPLPAPVPVPVPAPVPPAPTPVPHPPPPATPRFQPPFPALPEPPLQSLTCSPCKKIAFVSTRDRNYEIYTVNADGSELTRLTSNDAIDSYPSWSPDGQRIAFTSTRDGNSEIYVMDADGRNVERRTFSKGWATAPAWSPDGLRIAYGLNTDGSYNLWEVPAVGGAERLLFSTPGFDMNPSWSSDGTRLTFVSDWFTAAESIAYDLFQINENGSGFTALTDGIVNDKLNYHSPSWSPNGRTIALTVQLDFMEEDYVNWLGVMNADGTNLTLLLVPRWRSNGSQSYAVEYFYEPSWSPDNTTLTYTHFVFDEGSAGGHYEVAWVKADGSAQGTITTNGSDPDWQP